MPAVLLIWDAFKVDILNFFSFFHTDILVHTQFKCGCNMVWVRSLACGCAALRVTEGEEQRTRHLAPLLLKAGHLVHLQVVFTHNALHCSPPTAFGSLEAELCFWVEPSLFLWCASDCAFTLDKQPTTIAPNRAGVNSPLKWGWRGGKKVAIVVFCFSLQWTE